MAEVLNRDGTEESSRQVLESYLEGQIQEYTEMCDTLRAYHSQNLDKIRQCETDVRIMQSREDSGFALLSPISIESSFQVEISQALERKEMLEKQNEKYMRDVSFYENKIEEMEEQLRKARSSQEAGLETAAAVLPDSLASGDGSSKEDQDALPEETGDPVFDSFDEPVIAGSAFSGAKVPGGEGLKEALTRLQGTVLQASRFTRVDPRRAAMELDKAAQQIREMLEAVSEPAGASLPETTPSSSDGQQPEYAPAAIKNEAEPDMQLPHSSYLSPKATAGAEDPPQEKQEEKEEDALICVQASDISDVFEEYTDSFAAISAKRTDYYYEDETDLDVPKDIANHFVILCQRFYKYLLNYANCGYIQFRLRCYDTVLVTLFEWTSDAPEKDMEDTVEWYTLRREAIRYGLDVNRNSFENDIIRITVTCNVKK